MVYNGILEGKYVNLRSVEERDAEFTLSLRQDPNLTKYIPKLDITLEQQVSWIRKQRNLDGDYYFVIENKEGKKIGVLGVYDVSEKCAETGRIAIVGSPLESIEAQLLSFVFSFDILKLDYTVNYVLADNVHALRGSQLFGSKSSEPYEDENGNMRIDGVITKEAFMKSKEKLSKILYR